MPQTTGIHQPQISACQHDQSLLFQFVFSEFLTAHHEFQTIKSLFKQISEEIDIQPSKSTIPHQKWTEIIAALTQLSGSSHEYMRIFSWNQENGFLAKLKNHCAMFQQNSEEDDKYSPLLETNANACWLVSLQLLNTARCLQNLTVSKKTYNGYLLFSDFQKEAARLNRSLRTFSRIIAKIIPNFSDDENVIFFILRSHEQIDRAFGHNFTANLFTSMYSSLKKTSQFLQKNYARRGFHDLLPVIAQKIAQLDSAL